MTGIKRKLERTERRERGEQLRKVRRIEFVREQRRLQRGLSRANYQRRRIEILKENYENIFQSEETKKNSYRNFEQITQNFHHARCAVCHQVSLNIKMYSAGSRKCSKCGGNGYTMDFYEKQNALPIWYDNGKPQFHQPECLKKLRLAEMMLIQKISPLIPLTHIKKGTMGLQGHTCAFPQNIQELVTTLPRMPKSVHMIRIMKIIKEEIGSDRGITKAYLVRREVVLEALYFLKKYNSQYSDIQIEESNLDWFEGEEGCLKTFLSEVEELNTMQDMDANDDLGPAVKQAIEPKLNGNDVVALGLLVEDDPIVLSGNDKIVNRELQERIKKKTKNITMNWPATSKDPMNEFRPNGKLFVLAFPWLFPGGVGDISDWPKRYIADWGRHLLYYEDGRFMTDPFFCFYAMNYIVRHLNSNSGRFFLDEFNRNAPGDLQELKERIDKNDLSFVRNLTYYSKRITGSNPYWLQKKSELYTWLNHHVAHGNGAPTFFLTLSCAEYFWPDVIDLLKERRMIAGDTNVAGIYPGAPKLVQLVNENALVIQEYFQKRFEVWMETVGKPVFGINHYWARYEFAPGRGQIHVHLLAISQDQDVVGELSYHLLKKEGEEARTELLADYARRRFGLTACVEESFENIDENNIQENPVAIRFTHLGENKQLHLKDVEKLKHFCQLHNCSDFCMRKAKKGSKKCRECKTGCGTEKMLNGCDTPGFPLRNKPNIAIDHRGSKKLYLKRNHSRLNQSSIDLLQSWRGNCDIQLLIYDSNPKEPSLEEIAAVTDYIVAYECKGNCSLKEEREQNKNLIMKTEELTGDEYDIRRVIKQVMNRAVCNRLISKQECMVLLGKLDLTKSTEMISSVSLSTSKQVKVRKETKKKTDKTEEKFAAQYQKRSQIHDKYTLHQYWGLLHPDKIPHYVGLTGQPTYPVREDFARNVILIHTPWRTYPTKRNWIDEFNDYINKPNCDPGVMMTYTRVRKRYYKGLLYSEPTSRPIDHSGNPISDDTQMILDLAGDSNGTDYDLENMKLKNVPRGENYTWSTSNKKRKLLEPNIEPENWLTQKVSQHNTEARPEDLSLPRKPNGDLYDPLLLNIQQQDICTTVLLKLHEFMLCQTNKDYKLFSPLRMIINGPGGTGKSVLINTLVCLIRSIFNNNNTLDVLGPTGVAAYNVGGSTIHNCLKQGINDKSYIPGSMKETQSLALRRKFQSLLAIIIDERSMLSSQLFGTLCQKIQETIYEGRSKTEPWGGLPVMLICGDDYQLPPSFDKGAFSIYNTKSKPKDKMVLKGQNEFLMCCNNVMNLTIPMRLKDCDKCAKQLLGRLRVAQANQADADKLMSLHLDVIEQKFGIAAVESIKKRAVYLYWTNALVDEHNLTSVCHAATVNNPLCIVKTKSQGWKNGKARNDHYTRSDESYRSSILLREAQVAIRGRNICPLWALHNGACGTVEEIIFEKGFNPNHGDQPKYVVVNFPLYCGPIWDELSPKSVPIPVMESRCKRGCCTRTFLPLTLAYARTVHKFQGLTAGPVDEGRIPNMYECIICDPGPNKFERINPGLLYTVASRATTFGDENGKNSALYFTGNDMKQKSRIMNIDRNITGEMCDTAKYRKKWTARMAENHKDNITTWKEQQMMFTWAQKTRYDKNQLQTSIDRYMHFCGDRAKP